MKDISKANNVAEQLEKIIEEEVKEQDGTKIIGVIFMTDYEFFIEQDIKTIRKKLKE